MKSSFQKSFLVFPRFPLFLLYICIYRDKKRECNFALLNIYALYFTGNTGNINNNNLKRPFYLYFKKIGFREINGKRTGISGK